MEENNHTCLCGNTKFILNVENDICVGQRNGENYPIQHEKRICYCQAPMYFLFIVYNLISDKARSSSILNSLKTVHCIPIFSVSLRKNL